MRLNSKYHNLPRKILVRDKVAQYWQEVRLNSLIVKVQTDTRANPEC